MKSIDRILIVGFALTFIDLVTGRQVSTDNPGLFILAFEMVFAFYGILYLLPMVVGAIFNRSTRNKILLLTPILAVYVALGFIEVMKTDFDIHSSRGLGIDGEIIFAVFCIGYMIVLSIIKYRLVRKHDTKRKLAENEQGTTE